MRLRLSELAKLRGTARDEALVALGILDANPRSQADIAKYRQYIKKHYEDQVGLTIEEVRVKLASGELPLCPLIEDWLLAEEKFDHQNGPDVEANQAGGQALKGQGK